ALALALAAALGWQVLHMGNLVQVQRSLISSMPGTTILATNTAISPDGSKLVYVGKKTNGETSLWMRPLSSLTAQELAGTTNAIYPFWSPDSRFIGFFADAKLKKTEASGGAVISLCDAPNGRGGTWNKAGVILFAPNATSGLYQVSEDGGTPTGV